LDKQPVIEYLRSNIVLLKYLIANGYEDRRTLERRVKAMQEWIDDPHLLEPDLNAQYAEVIEIDLAEINEPLVACPNDPDDVRPLSVVAGERIDEVFIGSCMANIGHFRAAATVLEHHADLPVRLWVAPPTKMDQNLLVEEGYYATFGRVGARMETPGCSLCMGNQAQIRKGATAMSTSTRNFPNRLGLDTRVYLGSAELAAACAVLGRIPTKQEYMDIVATVDQNKDGVYQYLSFDQIGEFNQAVDNPVR
jgi:aconitate hydratase 2/2-methylisocitrate dehydratase